MGKQQHLFFQSEGERVCVCMWVLFPPEHTNKNPPTHFLYFIQIRQNVPVPPLSTVPRVCGKHRPPPAALPQVILTVFRPPPPHTHTPALILRPVTLSRSLYCGSFTFTFTFTTQKDPLILPCYESAFFQCWERCFLPSVVVWVKSCLLVCLCAVGGLELLLDVSCEEATLCRADDAGLLSSQQKKK